MNQDSDHILLDATDQLRPTGEQWYVTVTSPGMPTITLIFGDEREAGMYVRCAASLNVSGVAGPFRAGSA